MKRFRMPILEKELSNWDSESTEHLSLDVPVAEYDFGVVECPIQLLKQQTQSIEN